MDRTIAESSSRWTIGVYAQFLPPAEASTLLQRLTKSTACVTLFQQLLLLEENQELARIKDFMEQNPLRFDPNPWDYLPIQEHDQSPVDSIPPYSCEPSAFSETPNINLTSLPTEILVKIGAWLSEASMACLAMVNRDLHNRFGAQYHGGAVRWHWRGRFEFLQLLERDTKEMIACPRCVSLHFWRKNNCEFRWWKPNFQGIPHKFPYIPRFYLRLLNYLDYGFARMIGRLSVRFGPKSPQCHQALTMATPKRKSLWLPTVRASRSISNRIVDGNLTSRSQIAISPYWTTGTFTNTAFWILTTALTAPQFQICDHIDFPMFLRYVDAMASQPAADPDQDQYPNSHSISEAGRWGTDGVMLQDNYTYYKSSQDGLGILGQSGGHSEREIPQQFHDQILSPGLRRLFDRTIRGQVRSCSQCATDFGLGVQYVPGVGKALVMTIWRDVGGPCKKGEDELRAARKWKWDSHRCDRYVLAPPNRGLATTNSGHVRPRDCGDYEPRCHFQVIRGRRAGSGFRGVVGH